MSYLLIPLLVLMILGVIAEGAAAEDAPQPRAVPPGGKITMTDYGYRDWGPALVHSPVPAGKHELLVKDYTYPPVWRRQFTPSIRAALTQAGMRGE